MVEFILVHHLLVPGLWKLLVRVWGGAEDGCGRTSGTVNVDGSDQQGALGLERVGGPGGGWRW